MVDTSGWSPAACNRLDADRLGHRRWV